MKARGLYTLLILLALTLITPITGCYHDSGRSQQLPPVGKWMPSIEEEMEALALWRLHAERFYIYVQDPDGRKRVWAVSQGAEKPINSILSAYTQKSIEGRSFHEVTSWKDIAELEAVVHEDRDRMIWKLFNEVSYLKRRVTILERKLSEDVEED